MIASIDHQPIVLRGLAISKKDILPVHQHATSLIFENCTSTVWDTIGRAIASLPQLQTLALLHCNPIHDFYEELSLSKSLLRMRVGTC